MRTIDLSKRHICTRCGKRDFGMRKSVDCDDQVHWFHLACWAEFCDWMSGKGSAP